MSSNPSHNLAKEMTHDLELNFNNFAPFSEEDTANELQDHVTKTQNSLVDANAKVADIERAIFRAFSDEQGVRHDRSVGDFSDRCMQRSTPLPWREPSGCHAIASLLEGCSYIDGSPQNPLVLGIPISPRSRTCSLRDDFESGQTKMMSALVEFFVGATLATTTTATELAPNSSGKKSQTSPATASSPNIPPRWRFEARRGQQCVVVHSWFRR